MRSWVIGRLPRAAARWSGVRASRGETQEFTWNITMSLKECFSSGLFENSRIFQLGANLFEWGVCQRKWYLCDVTPEARVWYLFMIIQQQEFWHKQSFKSLVPANCVNERLRRWVRRWQGCQPFFPLVPGKVQLEVSYLEPLSWLLIDYIVTFFL